MHSIMRVNQLFLEKEDVNKVLWIVFGVFAKGKAVEQLSYFSKKRLEYFVTSSKHEFLRTLIAYALAVVLISPINVVFNEFVARLRQYWSHKLGLVLASKMLKQKLRNEDDDKSFETLVSSEADRFVELQIDLSVEALEALTHLYFFTRILWKLSPKLGSAGLATAVFGTSASILLGHAQLARLFREERKAVGSFAHNLSRCRENLESIQFASGVDFELERIDRLDDARQNAITARKRGKDLMGMFSLLLRRLAGGVLPSIILRDQNDEHDEKFHSKDSSQSHSGHGSGGSHSHSHQHNHLKPNSTHGGLTEGFEKDHHGSERLSELAQASEAFDEILFHLLIVTENFHNATRLVTIGNDICALLDRNSGEVDSEQRFKHLELVNDVKEDKGEWMNISSLSVAIPQSNIKLLNNLSFSLAYGDTLLVTGASGSGKTALLRVLFGLWPAAEGMVTRPSDNKLIALPQKPFCSSGSLAEQVTYPKPALAFSTNEIEAALRAVGLGHLLDRYSLESVEKWQEQLSMGEQQRLGFSRVILQKPTFAFFDESSSNLDLDSESKMYELVSDVVKGGFISIGHRRSIEKFHLHKITMYGPKQNGEWKREF